MLYKNSQAFGGDSKSFDYSSLDPLVTYGMERRVILNAKKEKYILL